MGVRVRVRVRDLTGVTIPVWTEHFANDQNTLQVEERGGAVTLTHTRDIRQKKDPEEG